MWRKEYTVRLLLLICAFVFGYATCSYFNANLRSEYDKCAIRLEEVCTANYSRCRDELNKCKDDLNKCEKLNVDMKETETKLNACEKNELLIEYDKKVKEKEISENLQKCENTLENLSEDFETCRKKAERWFNW